MIRVPFFLMVIILLGTSRICAQKSKCDTNSWTPVQRAEIGSLIMRGINFEDQELLDSAIAMNKDILRICPDFAPALTTIAGLYGRLGKYNVEIEWAHKA